jgi:adenosyl cobinamide kinase/adenosyl cobinamide phosphate guanylyltransferase
MGVLWILGEAKSGKSELGEEIFHRLLGTKFYIGTLPKTPENAAQIRKHGERRPSDWELIEVTDDLSDATRIIESRAPEGATVLLDGFAVYVQECARRWESEHPHLTIEAEAPFVEATCRAFADLAYRCAYLIVVDHISTDPPSAEEYAHDPARWRLRQVVTSCRASAHHIIHHDRTDVTHTDTAFVERTAKRLIAFGALAVNPPGDPGGKG